MALIGKIREKSGLLVIIVGLALVVFIMGDLQKILNLSEDKYGLGTVFSEKVDMKTYQETNAKFFEQDQQQFASQQREYTEKDQDATSDKAWAFTVESIIFDKEFEALGIDVSDDEFDAYLYGRDGFTVLPDLEQGFRDSLTGLFNPKLLEKRIEQMESSDDPKVQQQWKDSKKYYADRRKQEKYFELLTQGAFVTKLEAEDEYYAQNERKNISFVVRRYDEISDADVKISDEELQNYYEEHKEDKKYENRVDSREIRYFEVVVNPSRKDTLVFNKKMNEFKKGLQTSTNDSLYVLANSDIKAYSSSKAATAVPENHEKANKLQSYPLMMDTVFKTASIGQVVGPYNVRGNVVISKVIGFTPSKLKARHILIGTNQSTDSLVLKNKKKTADSLLSLINKDNFKEYVTKFSTDQGSIANGGEYDNFLEADMVPEFSTFCATQPIGKIGIVKTTFGYHIIEVLDRDNSKFPVLASIVKRFEASPETANAKQSEVYNLLYKIDNKLSKIENNTKKLAMFDTIAMKAGYFVRPLSMEDNNPKVYGFESKFAEQKVLKLAFNENAKVGDITTAPISENNKYYIAVVSSIRKKGVPTFEDAEIVMKRDLMEEKKAERLSNAFAKDPTLKAMAKRANSNIMQSEINFANPTINGAGVEPEIVGVLFSGMKDGQKTIPMKGKMGVYVVRIDKTIKAPSVANFQKERDALIQSLKGNIQSQALTALKKKAEVVDNRKLYNYGIRR